MASLPFVPGSQPAGPPDVSALLGAAQGQAPDQQQQQAGPQQDAAKAVMYQVHDLRASVEALARQFPQVADEMKQINDLLMSAMLKVVGSASGPEAPGPQVIG